MGKKKVGFKKTKSSVDNLRNAASSDDDDEIETQLQSVLDDEIDQYNAFKEKSLLDKGKKAKTRAGKSRPDDSDEEEVYGLNISSDDEGNDDEDAERLLGATSDEDDDNDDDILGGEGAGDDDGIPDSRAWGKKARTYHDTDYVDQDFGGFEGSDAEMAEQEESEAKEIQKRLTAELEEADFLGLVPAVATKSKKAEKEKEILKVDFDSLSSTEKRRLIQRECPEVVHMLDERNEKLAEAKALKEEMENQSSTYLRDYYVTKFHTIMNYCINISYYLYLRATSPTNCKGHPVIKRILQFRRLLDELNTFNPKKYLKSLKETEKLKKKMKKSKLSKKKSQKSLQSASLSVVEEKALEDQMGDDQGNLEEEIDANEEGDERRGINYTIAKNKGLTPYRKKELKNPRVKHRIKFKKATVRRKGQVRKPRTETHRYEGELSGIKMNITKSIKLK